MDTKQRKLTYLTVFILSLGLVAPAEIFASSSEDARNIKECQEVLKQEGAKIDALLVKADKDLLAKVARFFNTHNITWSDPQTAVAGLKAQNHAELSNIERLHRQFKGFSTGDTGSKAKCTNMASLLKQDYTTFYQALDGQLSVFLAAFIKCPDRLTKENIQALRNVQEEANANKEAQFPPSTPIGVSKPYVSKTVSFYSDPDNFGEKFPKKRLLSLNAASNNNEQANDATTDGNKTYCTYK